MWDINELELKLKRLKTRLKHETITEKREIILLDIFKLEELISYIKPTNLKTKKELKSKLFFEELNNHINSKKELIVDRDYRFLLDLNFHNQIRYPLFLTKNKISTKEYLSFMSRFLDSYDPLLNQIFHKMLNENKIDFMKEKNKMYKALGEAFYLPTDGSNYITFIFQNKLNSGSVLAHELIHAHQSNKKSSKEYFNLFYSLFLETYSRFIEYVFSDYLKTNGYNTIGNEIGGRLIDEFNVTTDYYIDKLLNIKKLEYKNGNFCKSNEYIRFKDIRNLYSNLLAMYFISQYRKDKKEGLKLVQDFDNKIGIVDDRELLEEYSNEMFANGYNSCVKHYIKHY